MTVLDEAYNLWMKSAFVDDLRQGREMAYLFYFERWQEMIFEYSHPGPYDPYRETLFGWPVYQGSHAPPDGILFLPERTVRSMAGIFPA